MTEFPINKAAAPIIPYLLKLLTSGLTLLCRNSPVSSLSSFFLKIFENPPLIISVTLNPRRSSIGRVTTLNIPREEFKRAVVNLSAEDLTVLAKSESLFFGVEDIFFSSSAFLETSTRAFKFSICSSDNFSFAVSDPRTDPRFFDIVSDTFLKFSEEASIAFSYSFNIGSKTVEEIPKDSAAVSLASFSFCSLVT